MTDPKQYLHKQFKDEADDTLFEGLDINAEFKDEVRKKVNKRNTRFEWLSNLIWKKRTLSTVSVATFACILVMLTPMILDSQNKTNTGEDINLNETPIDNKVGTLAGDSNTITDPTLIDYVDLKTKEEAIELLGDGLMVPAYHPEYFELSRIHALENSEGKATKVIFTYTSENQSYLVIADTNTQQFGYNNFKRITINGDEGFLKPDDPNDSSAELHLYTEEFHYMIGGLISSDEAIKIAESLE
ncbi:DUF4367 domain-containing protein [Alkalihalobacillus sp. AL-G]|uniref:DUF4367 domain-containing protein n=1 Tax=Alkalihalobacillus sp. AL-G TaxID=2926399 RepID=UPI00272AB68A|nr:DUF4367 domain-containing protein [Alkalihalobacillus sp. AL-G]WLD93601.1 DUF4367 domain-containing protein [Alkalihalobacillus sp. AL-G]